MKTTLRIATKDPYCFIEPVFEGTVDEAYAEYERLTALIKDDAVWQKKDTFTGETILYDEKGHNYKTLDGQKLYGGSSYKKMVEKNPFNAERQAPLTAKKLGVDPKLVAEMWESNRVASSHFGTSLHLAMEHYFKYRNSGTDYCYMKNPFLKGMIESFKYRDVAFALPEVFVSDIAKFRVGQIDLLVEEAKGDPFIVVDYKTDADIQKSLKNHFNQMSYYATQLIDKGFPVKNLLVANYTTEWSYYESPVLPLINKELPAPL